MPNKMLIDASHPEETRVVVTRGNRIEEFDFESQDKKQLKGNIYLARVTRVEPSLQAAFVEYGGNRHGFLAFSEIHPDYYQIPVADRQALLKAEADAAQAEDDDEDENGEERGERRNGRRRGRGGGRGGRERAVASGGDSDETAGDADAAPAAIPSEDEPAPREESEASDVLPDTDETPGEDDDGNDRGGPAMAMAIEPDAVSELVPAPEPTENGGSVIEVGPGADESEVESVGAEDAIEEARARRRPVRRQYKIQEVIKRRQILLVQVVKEERGNKGAALTTYLSLAGRYSVLMPNTARGGGISRKITSAEDRKRLKEVVRDLDVPQGMGVILRTAGESRTKAEIKRDYEYLMRMWETVRNTTLSSTAPALVYEEGSLIKRSVRDLYNKDISEIQVAGEDGYREAKDFMRMLMPSHAKMVQPYRDTVPIFARNGIEAQLDRMLQPQVTLKSGGYIIINQTEALVSIDVNSGRSTREHSIEDTALQTNLEAAEEVARQLRLRDLAGLIVIDFIDMEENRNNRAVEKRMKDCLKNDRARIQVGRISHFGLLEMSRQRIRASVLESTMKPCPHCGGTGHVRSDSSVALHVVRAIEEYLLKDNRSHIVVKTSTVTALYVLNHKRATLVDMEKRFGVTISLEADETLGVQLLSIMRGALAENPVPLSEIVSATAMANEPEEDEDEPIVDEAVDEDEVETARAEPASDEVAENGDGGHDPNKRRKRRRRRGGRDRDQSLHQHTAATTSTDEAGRAEDDDEDEGGSADAGDGGPRGQADAVGESDGDGDGDRKKRRRGRRGGKRNRRDDEADGVAAAPSEATGEEPNEASEQPIAESLTESVSVLGEAEPEAPVSLAELTAATETEPSEATDEPVVEEKPKAKPRARRSRKKVDEVAVTEAAPIADITADVAGEAEAAAPTETPVVVKERAVLASEDTIAPDAEEPASPPAEDTKPKKGGWWQRKGFF